MSSHVFDVVNQLGSISVATEPVSIHKHLHHILMLKNFRVKGGKILNSLIFKLVGKNFGWGTHRHQSH
jgi:hypothetical protein